MSRSILSITDLWREYKQGINGQMSVETLESNYKSKWRTCTGDDQKTAANRKFYSRRKKIYDAIKNLSAEKRLSENIIVDKLEALRVQRDTSIHWISENVQLLSSMI